MQKVLLAYRCSDEGAANPFERVLPVGLGYIHSYLRAAGVPASLANFSAVSRRKVRDVLRSERPDIVGISCFTFNRGASLELARWVKAALPHARVVMGGPHPTHAGASMMPGHPEVDVCVAGEGEITMRRVAETLSAGGDLARIPGLFLRSSEGIASTGAAEVIADLDALPFPARYPEGFGVDPRAQYPYVVTSRGCPAKCTFCSSPEFWGSAVRFRSAENILDELELLRSRFGILYVSFRDDIFTLRKERILALCKGMIERRLSLLWDCQTRVNTIDEERLAWMKRAGATILQFGIESGSQRILDRLRKGQTVEAAHRAAALTRKAGLVLSVYLITGVPGETEEDLNATEEMLKAIRPHDGIVTPLAVFPGTELWEQFRSGLQETDDFWAHVGHDGVYVRPDRFTGDALMRLASSLEGLGADGAYAAEDFDRHDAVTGRCHAGDLMRGEALENAGETESAKDLYAALAGRESWNPWPRLRLARLALAAGERAGARAHAESALALVPESAEAQALLLESRRRAASPARPARRPATKALAARPPRSGAHRAFQSWPLPPEQRTR